MALQVRVYSLPTLSSNTIASTTTISTTLSPDQQTNTFMIDNEQRMEEREVGDDDNRNGRSVLHAEHKQQPR